MIYDVPISARSKPHQTNAKLCIVSATAVRFRETEENEPVTVENFPGGHC